MIKYLASALLVLSALNLSAQMKIDTLDIENYQINTLKISEKLDEISSLAFHDGV